MSTNATEQAAKRETTIEADPNLPTIRIIRDFDAPPREGLQGMDRPGAGLPSGSARRAPR